MISPPFAPPTLYRAFCSAAQRSEESFGNCYPNISHDSHSSQVLPTLSAVPSSGSLRRFLRTGGPWAGSTGNVWWVGPKGWAPRMSPTRGFREPKIEFIHLAKMAAAILAQALGPLLLVPTPVALACHGDAAPGAPSSLRRHPREVPPRDRGRLPLRGGRL